MMIAIKNKKNPKIRMLARAGFTSWGMCIQSVLNKWLLTTGSKVFIHPVTNRVDGVRSFKMRKKSQWRLLQVF
jgi:hypothetical protein